MKNKILPAIFSFFALLILSLQFAQAGQITLEIATTTGISDSLITADFRITNKGIDPAHEVSVQGRFLDQSNNAFIADRIGPDGSAAARLEFHRPDGLAGTFPVYVTVTYQHAEGISVSSVSLARVNIGDAIQNILAAKAFLEDERDPGRVTILLETSNSDLAKVVVSGHGPGDLYIEPPFREVALQDGKGTATFSVSNISGNDGSTYGVFFAAKYEHNGRHDFASAEIAIPVEEARSADSVAAEALRTRLYGLVLAAAALFIIIITISTRTRQWFLKRENIPRLLDIFVLIAVEVFIFSKFDLVSLLTATTTTGGDTASHYYTLEYLRNTLLPAGKISGWTMGNYAGFPILQFYFPLPFLLMSFLDLFMDLQVAFKLVTLAGTALLPIGAFIMLRLIRCPFPGPGIGAALMLPFLFNPANSMWGGNILSTLAGEFSYSLSMALSLILIGSLYRGALEDKGVVRNAVLVFLVGFSHGYTLLFVEAMSLFLLLTPYGFFRRFLYLFRVYALGFCLLAYWLVPLLVFTRFTTSYHLVWTIGSIKEIVPEILLPVIILGVGGSVILLAAGLLRFRTDGREILKPLAFLWFGLAAAVVFFVAAPRIGVVDIRYVPYGQLMTCLMAALFLGWAARYLLNRWGLSYLFLIVATVVVMSWTGGRLGPVPGWSKWNYEGFEAKKSWPLFEQINKTLAGNFNDPRVVYEHSEDHNMFGSSRAFESLPLFAGRATLEGLYMQASITAPFVFYIQSMISDRSSQPFPQYSYTSMDYARARDYLKLFNVRELVIKSSAAKQAIRQNTGYARIKTMGPYEIWQLTENRDRYVEVLEFEPVAYIGSEPWKQAAHRWFSRDDLPDIHLVFPEIPAKNPANLEWLSAASLDVLPRKEVDVSSCNLTETIGNQEILLETSCPGKPHLVKVSYHPNWQVDGAERIYLVSPSFMLIYPQKEQVRLFYGPGPWDRLGRWLTFFGLVILLMQIPLPTGERRTGLDMLKNRFWRPDFFHFRLAFDPSSSVRRLILLAVLMGGGTFVAAVAYQTYVHEPYRAYNRAIRSKDAGQYEKARAGFRSFMQTYPMANLARESSYYLAITYYLENRDNEALRGFEEYLLHYPQGSRAAEVHYHIGLVLLRSGRQKEGVGRMVQLIAKFPGTEWAGYAGTRLQEHGFAPDGAQIDTREN